MVIYEIVVPLFILRTGTPGPFWFFVFQGVGHIATAATINKTYWWYGRPADLKLSRILLAVAGCAWMVAGYRFAK
jgi:hypothetical protein